MTTHRTLSIVGCAVAAMTLVACGSSSGSESAATTGVPAESTVAATTISPTTEPSTTTSVPPSTSTTSTTTSTSTSSTTSTTSTTEPAPRDPSKLYLPTPPTVGEAVHQVVTSANTAELDAPGDADDLKSSTLSEFIMDRQVTSVADDSFVVTETIVGGSIELSPVDADDATVGALTRAFDELTGTIIETTFGFDGVERGRVVIDGETLSALAHDIITTPAAVIDFMFNTGGIAVGDIWTVEASGGEVAAGTDVAYTLELVAFDGVSYQIEISVDEDVSELFRTGPEADSAGVRMTGTGFIIGDTTNSLLISSTMVLDISGTIIAPDGEPGTLSIVTTTSMISTPL